MYRFVRNVYETWTPSHLTRIRFVLDALPALPEPPSFPVYDENSDDEDLADEDLEEKDPEEDSEGRTCTDWQRMS